MARRRNEIAVKWLESKDKGKINRVNVKHVLGDLSYAVEGSEVVVKFGSRQYRATIIDLLEWQPPVRCRKSKDTRAGEQPPQSSAKNATLKGSAKKTKASKSSAAKSSITSKHSAKAIKPLWLGSGSPAKSSTELQVEEEALRRAETRAVLGEITNIPQHHNDESPSPEVRNPTNTPSPLSEHDASGTPTPLSDHDHCSVPSPLSHHDHFSTPTPLSDHDHCSVPSPLRSQSL